VAGGFVQSDLLPMIHRAAALERIRNRGTDLPSDANRSTRSGQGMVLGSAAPATRNATQRARPERLSLWTVARCGGQAGWMDGCAARRTAMAMMGETRQGTGEQPWPVSNKGAKLIIMNAMERARASGLSSRSCDGDDSEVKSRRQGEKKVQEKRHGSV
jgi:hypothetical protein